MFLNNVILMQKHNLRFMKYSTKIYSSVWHIIRINLVIQQYFTCYLLFFIFYSSFESEVRTVEQILVYNCYVVDIFPCRKARAIKWQICIQIFNSVYFQVRPFKMGYLKASNFRSSFTFT